MGDSCCPPKEQTCCPAPEPERCFEQQSADKNSLPPSVVGTVDTPAGPVPGVTPRFKMGDRWGIWKARWGIGRMSYTIPAGLYALGRPDSRSDVLVTANFRMTFDLIRKAAETLDVWILVLDTKGINVWCAAGKGTFGTDELVARIVSSGLKEIVDHGRVIVPQLGAVGIAAHKVKEYTGFDVIYGPVESRDIQAFLAAGRVASPAMRKKNFPLLERAALAPMELVPAVKWAAIIATAMALTGGLTGSNRFLSDVARFGLESAGFLAIALVSGAVLVPLLLPWIPGRAFSVKGAVTGTTAAVFLAIFIPSAGLKGAAWTLLIIAISSFLAMNFTGSSTYTSLSGVRKEMNMAVPAQIVAAVAGLIFWVSALFLNNGGPV